MKRLTILIFITIISLNSFSQVIELSIADSLLKTEKVREYIIRDLYNKSVLNPIAFAGNKNFGDLIICGLKDSEEENIAYGYGLAICRNFYVKEDSVYSQNSIIGLISIRMRKYFTKRANKYDYSYQNNWIRTTDVNSLDANFLKQLQDDFNSNYPNNYSNEWIYNNLQTLIQNTYSLAFNYFIVDKIFEDLGFAKRIYPQNNSYLVDIDFIQWLDGDKALEKAKEKGIDELPNGYYILNENPKIRTFPIIDTALIVLEYPYGHVERDTFDLVGLLKIIDKNTLYKNDILANFRIQNGVIVEMKEIYRP